MQSLKMQPIKTNILKTLYGILVLICNRMEQLIYNRKYGKRILELLDYFPEYPTPYFFRTHDGAECDLVLMQGQIAKYAIEIKYKSAPKLTRGNSLAFSEIQAEKSIVVVSEGETYFMREDIKVISLENFVKELSL